MNRAMPWIGLGLALVLGACVTINVYFPAAAAEKAADRIIDEVWAPNVIAKSLPVTTPFSLRELMVTEATVQKWVYEGLPADDHSVMNGILTTEASRFPLCIDPQEQAVSWIKAKETPHDLRVGTFLDGDFMKKLELCIQYGKPYLFEGIDEELDPMVDPILEKNTFMQGQQPMLFSAAGRPKVL